MLENITRDSEFIKNLDQDNLKDFYEMEQTIYDFKYIDYLYTDPVDLDLDQSLHLFNTLIKYDFKQVKEFTLFFYFKFGKESFKKDSFMIIIYSYIENLDPDEFITELCKNNFISCLKWIEKANSIYIDFMKNIIYTDACSFSNIEIVKWIFLKIDNNISNIKIGCEKSGINGNLEVFKYLYTKPYSDQVFLYVINDGGYLEIIKYIYLIKPFNISQLLSYNIKNVEIIKWILFIDNNIFESYSIEWVFKRSVEYGNLEVSKFLYSLNKFIITDIEIYIIGIVGKGYIEMFKWLYSLNIPNIQFNNLFVIACNRNKLEMAKYMYSENLFNEDEDFNNCFIEAIISEDKELGLWLLSLNIITINHNKLFALLINENKIKMAEFIYSIFDVDMEYIRKKSKIYNRDIKIIIWLIELNKNNNLDVIK
jgi:hypothetical protein